MAVRYGRRDISPRSILGTQLQSPSLNRILDQHSPDTCRSLGIKEEEEGEEEDEARLRSSLASLGKHEGREGRRTEGMIGGQGRGFPGARLAPVYTTNGMDDSSPWLNLFLIQWLPSLLASPRLVNSGVLPRGTGAREAFEAIDSNEILNIGRFHHHEYLLFWGQVVNILGGIDDDRSRAPIFAQLLAGSGIIRN